MIKIVTGETGEGKTKHLIDMANQSINETKGNVVYLDKDTSHMYSLRHEIRYINISDYPIDNYHEFFGFMCGVLSEDNDISRIFVDGFLKMAHVNEINNSEELVNKLKQMTDKFGVQLVVSVNCTTDELPENLRKNELSF